MSRRASFLACAGKGWYGTACTSGERPRDGPVQRITPVPSAGRSRGCEGRWLARGSAAALPGTPADCGLHGAAVCPASRSPECRPRLLHGAAPGSCAFVSLAERCRDACKLPSRQAGGQASTGRSRWPTGSSSLFIDSQSILIYLLSCRPTTTTTTTKAIQYVAHLQQLLDERVVHVAHLHGHGGDGRCLGSTGDLRWRFGHEAAHEAGLREVGRRGRAGAARNKAAARGTTGGADLARDEEHVARHVWRVLGLLGAVRGATAPALGRVVTARGSPPHWPLAPSTAPSHPPRSTATLPVHSPPSHRPPPRAQSSPPHWPSSLQPSSHGPLRACRKSAAEVPDSSESSAAPTEASARQPR